MKKDANKITSEKRNVLALLFFVTIFIYGTFVYFCNWLLKKTED